MSLLTTARCRICQWFYKLGARLRPPKKQEAELGPGALYRVGQLVRDRRLKKPMVILGPGQDQGAERLLQSLAESDIAFTQWDALSDPPTADDGENIRLSWLGEGCDSFIVLGDGPVIDIAKLAAARCARRGRTIMGMVGRNRIGRRRMPPVIAIPTTAGSGAEALSFAMVSDGRGNRFLVQDVSLIPTAAVLDSTLIEDVPREIIASRGMSGLCLAVEAFLSAASDDKARRAAAQATELFFQSLEPYWNSGGTAQDRENVLKASRLAGQAASQAGYGYGRAISRAVQVVTGMDMGLASGLVLPEVLEKYGISAQNSLAMLAEQSGLETEGTRSERAAALIDRIRGMAFRMGLPDELENFSGIMAEEIGDLAAAEANPKCACPAVWTAKECMGVIFSLQ
ncbi:MAG: iron-containing alcohol dehydrogenase [Oscillospiraceae bacterium]|nr:iron-containing alcohol dehydrogenase [Oscillospiraceae bacterium]